MKLSRKFFLAVLLVVLMAGSAMAARQDFTLYNYSGKTITKIYIIPSWKPTFAEKDRFTGSALPLRHGKSANMTFHSYPDEQYWDLRVYYANGKYENWSELDFFKISRLSIDKKGTVHWNF